MTLKTGSMFGKVIENVTTR